MSARALNPQLVTGSLLVAALAGLEGFNVLTNQAALAGLLGVTLWATALTAGFCLLDFAGLARLFLPTQTESSRPEVPFLIGAWLISAAANAWLTWLAVTMTMVSRPIGNEFVSREALIAWLPLIAATAVLFARVLMIANFAVSGQRLFEAQALPARHLVPAMLRPKARTAMTEPANGQVTTT
jgi:hypothetical protein